MLARAEYFLDKVGRNSIALEAECDDGELRVMASLNISELFTQHKGRLRRVTNRRVRPLYGAVHGTVFLDYNGNAERDPGEPGLPDVEVKLGKLYTAVTDEKGYYVLPGLKARKVRVSINLDSVPATYSPSRGSQVAYVAQGSLTEVNLSVTPLIAVSGIVRHAAAGQEPKPLYGARVVLAEPVTGKFVADSISASDGSYYIGNVRPGEYVLEVDLKTIPPEHRIDDFRRRIRIMAKKDFQEVKVPPFTAVKGPQ